MTRTSVCGVYACFVSTGALLLGMYASVLYQRKLALRRHQMYIDAFVRTLETVVRMRRMR